MIAEGGYAKVLDFGVAGMRAEMPRPKPRGDADSASLGRKVVGTVGYMSPEQMKGAARSADRVFSFGCVLHEAVTGKRAFQGTTSFETLKRILERGPGADCRAAAATCSCAHRPQCLAKNPDDRYQSMQELSHDMRGLLRRLEAATHRETADRVPWRRLLAGAAGDRGAGARRVVDNGERFPRTRTNQRRHPACHAQRHRH